ncbi:MAG: hypothetical protein AB7U20_02240 [Planctomycetaceae bacterium]
MNGLPTRTDRTLEEFASLEYILLGDLRDLLEESPSEQTSRWLLAVLDALLEALPQELALKSQQGYLEEVLCDHPHWVPQVERLRSEYVRLCVWLEELRDRLLNRSPFEEIASRLRYELREWMTALHAYHRHEHRLLQTSINLEVGGGD